MSEAEWEFSRSIWCRIFARQTHQFTALLTILIPFSFAFSTLNFSFDSRFCVTLTRASSLSRELSHRLSRKKLV